MARALDTDCLKNSHRFKSFVNKSYNSSLSTQAERYSKLSHKLKGDIKLFSSSGRVELIGNHTDHNNGLVLAATIDLDTIAAVIKSSNNIIRIQSDGYKPINIDINDLSIDPVDYGTSKALVKGVLKGFVDKGYIIGGFEANVSSTIFKGAGVSSSAAFELLICEILNFFYNNNKVDFITKAIISQYAENVYFNKPSGLMDQLTIARGGVSLMDFGGVAFPSCDTINFLPQKLSLVIINCGGDHSDLTREYAEIREDMLSIAQVLNKPNLREVQQEEFYKNIKLLHQKCSGRAILRAKHFIEENQRVKLAVSAIGNNDIELFCKCISASGDSSYQQLQNCYAVGDKKQSVPLGIQWAKCYPHLKAVRVHGGGFAGTILAVIDKNHIEGFETHMQKIFSREDIFTINIRPVGATVVEV